MSEFNIICNISISEKKKNCLVVHGFNEEVKYTAPIDMMQLYIFALYFYICRHSALRVKAITVEFQWLEHLWDYENKFERGVVRANEC